jgi:hypothetical protein
MQFLYINIGSLYTWRVGNGRYGVGDQYDRDYD